jgi:GTPase SAR1 family protein
MNQEWKKALNLKEDIYFGDFVDKDHFKYYFLSQNISEAISDFSEYTSDKRIFHPILLAGDAGSGKTSLIQYMYMHNLFKGFPLVLNLDKAINNKTLFESLLEHLEEYFHELSKINDDINNAYYDYMSTRSKRAVMEKIKFILNLHNSISKNDTIRNNELYLNLIVVIDQIDMLNSKELEKRIKEMFSVLESSKYIHKIVCARHDTLKISRAKTSSFFATIFRRQIEIFPSDIKDIIGKRLEHCSLGINITKIFFNTYLDKYKLGIIVKLSSNNVRNMLDILANMMRKTNPDKMKNNVNFVQFLMRNNYIPNLNEIVFSENAITAPVVRWVFEVLIHRNTIDVQFHKIFTDSIIESFGSDKYSIAINRKNIEEAVWQLKEFGLIRESIYNIRQFDLTNKGRWFAELISVKGYNEIYPFPDKTFVKFKVILK